MRSELARVASALYMRTQDDWIRLLGTWEGMMVCAMLVLAGDKRGAVPFIEFLDRGKDEDWTPTEPDIK